VTRSRILFLCTGNSCRSKMAEGWARFLGKGNVEAFSAGTQPKPIHPLAIKAMAEVGVDISGQASKPMDQFVGEPFDFVITVCDRAKEACPVWPGAREHIHWSLDDPAEATGTEAQRLVVFRRVRDEMREHVRLFSSSTGWRAERPIVTAILP
jgi:arsenate reductase